jgi:uncharacterized Zn-binding protein involved in type VI secretion
MLKAARLGDQISHTMQRSGLLGGMIFGALLVGVVVLAVASGGTAVPALLAIGAVTGGAAIGGGIGRLWGGEQLEPKGNINKAAKTVFINSRGTPAARACVDTALCDDHRQKRIAMGSSTVAIEGHMAARVTDLGECSFQITQGSDNVFIGGEAQQCAGIEITPEVEPWLEWTHRLTGWVSLLCLVGPAYGLKVAVVSLFGSEIGAHYGGQIGQHYFGKWGGVAGSILGGMIGGGIPLRPNARSFINRVEVDPNRLGTAGGNIRLRPKPKNSPDIKKWKEKGGRVDVLPDGTYRYTDWEGNVVDYKNGHPDFTPHQRQSVEIEQKGNHTTDYTDANAASKLNPPKLDENTWHHHENRTTMQEVPTDIHRRFTHRGGVSNSKK